MTVELLHFTPQTPRTTALFDGLRCGAVAADVSIVSSETYRGDAEILMLWGPGAPNRWPAMQAHRASGRRVIVWDLAYWHRDRKVRLSIDAAHPQAWVLMQDWPRTRFEQDRVVVRDVWNPDGPVIIAGVGVKAVTQYGDQIGRWEREQIALCRSRGRQVLYKPKRPDLQNPYPIPTVRGDIDQALNGAGLLMTWHSNAAVDAIRAGVPAICQDGAAAAVCASVLPSDGWPVPLSLTVRDRFLVNLAWFQWAPAEASSCWRWLETCLTGVARAA